jgi:hypothetical protein
MTDHKFTYDSAAKALAGNPAAAMAFKAHAVGRMSDSALKTAREKSNAKVLDSLVPGRGAHLSRELEFIYAETLEVQRESLNALRLFPVDTRVDPGATSHTIRRIDRTNEWHYFRSNTDNTGNAAVERYEQTFNVLPMVSGFRIGMFDELNSSFAGTNIRGEMERALVRGFEEFVNDHAWVGTELPGILNYPLLPKAVSPVSFANTTSADDIIAELHRLANSASERSKQVFGQRMNVVMDDRLYNRIATRKRSATTDQTILQAFLQDNPYVASIEPIHEMRDKGPGGLPGILFYTPDMDSIAHVIPRGMTMLPM